MDRRQLTIKAFNVNSIKFGDKVTLNNGELTLKLAENYLELLKIHGNIKKYIKSFKLTVINPKEKNIYVNSIMDFIPISTKVLGEIGYGITHTVVGAVVMLTGCDETKKQICEFGKSDGILSEKVKFGRAGTPEETDYIIHLDVEVYENAHVERECINTCHELCDIIVQEVREVLKRVDGKLAAERHDYYADTKQDEYKKKVVILKQVAGQGAMYDTRIFPAEPSGYIGGYSIIDCMNMPVFISVNEYRDGAIRAMH
ncbi:MAG: proline reductase cluster protein PrdD [Fusobacteriaceae bacterium]